MLNWNTIGSMEGRFTLHEDGQITWQDNKTNPMPGDPVATIQKGQAVLSPQVTMMSSDALDDNQTKDVKAKIEEWLQGHIKDVLAPLFRLIDETENKLEGAAKGIGFQLYENLGVIHRSEIESLVPDLTPELRATLRSKKVKMGPILVFMYELVKPAAINLRALLWGLWNEKPLPVQRPADGRVSVVVDPKAVDRNYLRSIGYPVFGNLAIRIDMLDRVVTDIYDSSKDFKFQAQHKYMEWLGCGEDDLYAVLQSMGFRKLQADKKEEEVSAPPSDITPPDPLVEPNSDANKVEKPDLAVFLLKKGKISDRPAPKTSKNIPKKAKNNKKSDKKPKNEAKTYQSKPKKVEIDDDSPFAILKQLQK